MAPAHTIRYTRSVHATSSALVVWFGGIMSDTRPGACDRHLLVPAYLCDVPPDVLYCPRYDNSEEGVRDLNLPETGFVPTWISQV